MKSFIQLIIGIAIVMFVINIIGGLFNYEDENAEYWFNEYDAESAYSQDLQYALEQANANIEEANSMIEDAKRCSWGCDYEEMQDTLDDLETVDTIDEP